MTCPATPIATPPIWTSGIKFTSPTSSTPTTTLARPTTMTMLALQPEELRRQQLQQQYALLQKAQAATLAAYNLPRIPRATSPTVPFTFMNATQNYQVPESAIDQYTNNTSDDYYRLVGNFEVLRRRIDMQESYPPTAPK